MNSKKVFEDQELEKKSKEIFETFKRSSLGASPYLKTRVLAELDAKKRHQTVVFWKRTAIASTASLFLLIVALLFMFNREPSEGFNAFTGQPLLVKVSISDIKDYNVAYAEVELPEKVTFYSKTNLDVMGARSLTLFNEPSDKDLPFVIRSEEKGVKEVKVTLYDDSDQVILEKKINIKFVNHG